MLVLAAIFAQVMTRLFPSLGRGHSRLGLIVAELGEMSTTYRGRLDVVVACLALRSASTRSTSWPSILSDGCSSRR